MGPDVMGLPPPYASDWPSPRMTGLRSVESLAPFTLVKYLLQEHGLTRGLLVSRSQSSTPFSLLSVAGFDRRSGAHPERAASRLVSTPVGNGAGTRRESNPAARQNEEVAPRRDSPLGEKCGADPSILNPGEQPRGWLFGSRRRRSRRRSGNKSAEPSRRCEYCPWRRRLALARPSGSRRRESP